MAHAEAHHEPETSHGRSAGLAFVLGLLFGGVAFFYVMPPGRAIVRAAIAYALVAVSGGILWGPVFLSVAFLAARAAKFSEGSLALHGHPESYTAYDAVMHESLQTPPSAYVRVRRNRA